MYVLDEPLYNWMSIRKVVFGLISTEFLSGLSGSFINVIST
jgi:hypothetical protein